MQKAHKGYQEKDATRFYLGTGSYASRSLPQYMPPVLQMMPVWADFSFKTALQPTCSQTLDPAIIDHFQI